MIYFNPIYGQWVGYFSDNNLNCSVYWIPGYVRAEVTNQTIIDNWNTISVPSAPELKPVTVDPKNTALLILDMESRIVAMSFCEPRSW